MCMKGALSVRYSSILFDQFSRSHSGNVHFTGTFGKHGLMTLIHKTYEFMC